MDCIYSYPGNIVTSSLADKDSKLLRLVGTISFGLHAYCDNKKSDYPTIDNLTNIGDLMVIARQNRLDRQSLQSISKNFTVNVMSKIGILPQTIIDCIMLDVEDLLGLPVSSNIKINASFSPRHYHKLSTSNIQDSFSAPYQTYKLWRKLGESSLKPSLVLTPLLQISIGHLFYLPLAITCSTEHEYRSDNSGVTIFTSSNGYGIDFYYKTLRNHAEKLRIYNSSSYLSGLIDPHMAWQAESWALTIGPKRLSQIEDKIHKVMNRGNSIGGPNIVFHFRTGNWKHDNRFNTHRDCDPLQYINLINTIGQKQDSIVITSDRALSEMLHIHGISVHLVSSRESSYQQWELISGAKLIVGCASGISHLENISQAPILYLNVLSQHAHHPIKGNHMFSIRYLKTKYGNLSYKGINRKYLFYGLLSGYDEGMNSFNSLFEVTHLNSKDMLEDYNEAITYFENKPANYPYTNKALALELGIEYDGPVRNLTKRSYLHLIKITQNLAI